MADNGTGKLDATRAETGVQTMHAGECFDAGSVRRTLATLAEQPYRRFAASLLPKGTRLLGVRLPALRRLARRITAGDWRGYLASSPGDSFEETLLRGLVVAGADMPLAERFRRVTEFVPLIDNWSVCDSFCVSLKWIALYREETFAFLEPFLASEEEFAVRFAVVTMLDHYLDDAYRDRVLCRLDRVRHPGYYARMAVAWATSMAYAVCPADTAAFMERCRLDAFTYRMTLRKIADSRQISPQDKQRAFALRRSVSGDHGELTAASSVVRAQEGEMSADAGVTE